MAFVVASIFCREHNTISMCVLTSLHVSFANTGWVFLSRHIITKDYGLSCQFSKQPERDVSAGHMMCALVHKLPLSVHV
jgi:hypothetical protein